MKYILGGILSLVVSSVKSYSPMVQVDAHCDLMQRSVWWKSYSPGEIKGQYKKELCFQECEDMAKAVFEKNKRAFKDDEPLCCNFAAWEGGSVTCDIMVGDAVTKQ